MTEKTKRKIILPERKRGEISEVNVVPTLESLMSDGLAIIGSELAAYRAKSKRGVMLDLKEARVIQAYMDAVVKLSKEDRERARAEDLANLSDEELKQLASEVLKLDLENNNK